VLYFLDTLDSSTESQRFSAHRHRLFWRLVDFDALIFRNHLSAQQEQSGRDFEAQQHDDGGGNRAVDHAHLRQRAEIPGQRVADDFPQHGRRRAGEQQAVVGLKRPLHLQRERDGVGDDVADARVDEFHGGP